MEKNAGRIWSFSHLLIDMNKKEWFIQAIMHMLGLVYKTIAQTMDALLEKSLMQYAYHSLQ